MDERRLLLFFAISLAILIGWQLIMPTPEPSGRRTVPDEEPTAETEASPERETTRDRESEERDVPPEPAEAALADIAPTDETEERRVTLENDRFRAVFSNRGAQLVSFLLKRHESKEKDELDLVRRRREGPYPFGFVEEDLSAHRLNEALFRLRREEDEGRVVLVFEYRGPEARCRKSFRLEPDGMLEVEVETAGAGSWGLLLGPGLGNPSPDEMEGRFARYSAVYKTPDDVETVQSADIEAARRLPGEAIRWAGLQDAYFLAVLAPTAGFETLVVQPVVMRATEGGPFSFSAFDDEDALDDTARDLPRDVAMIFRPGSSRLVGRAYLGAKTFDRLASFRLGFEETIGWNGMFGFIARPLLIGLVWIHDNVITNYGWAIVLLTIALKLVLFPLTHKGQKSMRKMQELQPQIQATRNRYKSKLRGKDGKMNLEAQRKMNEEIQELFRSEGASPMGGCLPMILQIPIFYGFFLLLGAAVELRHEPWVLWIDDLSVPDPLWILPILMGVSQIYQQRLTPQAGEGIQRRIMQIFPWAFAIFAISFPAGLVLYWTTNNVLTIGQTMIYNRVTDEGSSDTKNSSDTKKKQKRGKS